MIVILLGILDILAGISIFALKFSWGAPIVWFFVMYLIAKSLPFLKSVASIIDIIVACIFIFGILGQWNILTYLGALWLIQKGIVSFF